MQTLFSSQRLSDEKIPLLLFINSKSARYADRATTPPANAD